MNSKTAMTHSSETPSPVKSFDPLGVILWHGMSTNISAEFEKKLGVPIVCEAYSPKRQLAVRRCRLVSHIYATADLEMEQIELLMRHLPSPSTAEAIFALAQALQDGLESVSFDDATNRMKLPHARLKEEVVV